MSDSRAVRDRSTKSSSSSSKPDSLQPRPQGNRSKSYSQDSLAVQNPTSKKPRQTKRGNSHADIIDRLDYSGVGAAMFHHDGPFDACAPSRNKHRSKAPMLAWSSQDDSGLSDPALSPELKTPGSPQPPYESKFSKSRTDTPPDYIGKGGPVPKKRHDALAEAWGVAEPEPFEEFFAGGESGRASAANSVRAGADGHLAQRGAKDPAQEVRERRFQNTPRRSTQRAPPPKPIEVPGSSTPYAEEPPLSAGSDSSGPKRSRSLMHRIRKMRESPNIPVTTEVDNAQTTSSTPGSAQATRPTHRANNSFLGRFNKSPSSPTFEALPVSPFSDKARVDNPEKDKDLPVLPGGGYEGKDAEGYFDRKSGSDETGIGLARRTSLMRKVVNGVKRNAKA